MPLPRFSLILPPLITLPERADTGWLIRHFHFLSISLVFISCDAATPLPPLFITMPSH
jgi:hypothetical protein